MNPQILKILRLLSSGHDICRLPNVANLSNSTLDLPSRSVKTNKNDNHFLGKPILVRPPVSKHIKKSKTHPITGF